MLLGTLCITVRVYLTLTFESRFKPLWDLDLDLDSDCEKLNLDSDSRKLRPIRIRVDSDLRQVDSKCPDSHITVMNLCQEIALHIDTRKGVTIYLP